MGVNTSLAIANKIAEFLLQIKAVQLNVQHPFTWASGWRSPIYCDNRKILSYPVIRNFVRQEFVKRITEAMGTPDVIAGVATGGIAIGALVAQEFGLPFVYVRTEAKKHGLRNSIEGVLQSGQNVAVIEDTISTGKSSLQAVEAIRELEGNVKGMFSIFTYGFNAASLNFKEAKVPLFTLCDYDTLIQYAAENEYIMPEQLFTLKKWREQPDTWGNNL